MLAHGAVWMDAVGADVMTKCCKCDGRHLRGRISVCETSHIQATAIRGSLERAGILLFVVLFGRCSLLLFCGLWVQEHNLVMGLLFTFGGLLLLSAGVHRGHIR